MEWQAPSFVEIRMDAEFTAYVDDLDREEGTAATPPDVPPA